MTNLQNNTASLRAILETVSNLPEAGSGSGGGEATGVCPSLTVSMQHGWTDNITFSTNGMYTSRYWVDNITIQNIDIDQPIFMCVWGYLGGDIKVQNNINVEVLYNSNGVDGAFVFKCTSTEAAILEICDTGIQGG